MKNRMQKNRMQEFISSTEYLVHLSDEQRDLYERTVELLDHVALNFNILNDMHLEDHALSLMDACCSELEMAQPTVSKK